MQTKILIVDDDAEVLQTLGNIFTTFMQGYLVLTAVTANQGLIIMKEQKPDVIIVDVRLADTSGLDLISDFYSFINKNKISYHPAFIVITAYEDEDVRKKAEEFKVDAFLKKPFSKEKILYTVIEAITKIMHRELSLLDEIKGQYKGVIDRVNDIDKNLNNS